jgi:hypothetical protein
MRRNVQDESNERGCHDGGIVKRVGGITPQTWTRLDPGIYQSLCMNNGILAVRHRKPYQHSYRMLAKRRSHSKVRSTDLYDRARMRLLEAE